MRKSGRAIAMGTVFAWETREYEVDDITAAINGPFQAAPQSRESHWTCNSVLVGRLPGCISYCSKACRAAGWQSDWRSAIPRTAPHLSTKPAAQASSRRDSSSSLAHRCRFSTTRRSIRGTRTSLCGAGPAEAMEGTRIVKAPNNAEATIRLQRFRRALGIFVFFRILC
jgi:hypothetical protein